MIGLGKSTNTYAARIDVEIDAPKTVWMALAVSLANQLHGICLLDSGVLPVDVLMSEWEALYMNGIVPQRPRRKAFRWKKRKKGR